MITIPIGNMGEPLTAEEFDSSEIAKAWRPIIQKMIARKEIDVSFGRELYNRPYKYFTDFPSEELEVNI